MAIKPKKCVRTHSSERAFTLVELSIVLVILGLLVGGVLSGQSLIRAAELRSVSAQYYNFQTALNAFRDKYFTIPGDMDNATAFWGKDNASCSGHTGTAATPGTCNGNANGKIGFASGANATGETFRIWQHLALAGLIEGTYTGNAISSNAVLGTNVPRSKINGAGWSIADGGNYPGSSTTLAFNYSNMMVFGTPSTGGSGMTDNLALKTEEMWNIDTKMDDGKPATGKIITFNWNTCTNGTASNDYTKDYKLSDSTVYCVLVSPQLF